MVVGQGPVEQVSCRSGGVHGYLGPAKVWLIGISRDFSRNGHFAIQAGGDLVNHRFPGIDLPSYGRAYP